MHRCWCALCSSTGWSLWNLVDNVAQNANSFVDTIVSTDWQKELATLHDDLKEEVRHSHEGHAQAGPDSATRAGALPEDAPGAEQSPSSDQQDTEEAGPARQSGFSFAHFGQSLLTGTTEILEQVCAVASPLRLCNPRAALPGTCDWAHLL